MIGHGASKLVLWGARLVWGVGTPARTGDGRGRDQGVVSAEVSWAKYESVPDPGGGGGARGLSQAGVRSSEDGSGGGWCVQPDVIVVGVEGSRVSSRVDRILG